MKYEVRFIVDGDEKKQIVDVSSAAEAAEAVKNQHPEPAEKFELIQVQLLDEPSTADRESALGKA